MQLLQDVVQVGKISFTLFQILTTKVNGFIPRKLLLRSPSPYAFLHESPEDLKLFDIRTNLVTLSSHGSSKLHERAG